MQISGFRLLILVACGTLLTAAAPSPVAGVRTANASERAVVGLIETAFNQKKPEEAFERFVGTEYRQHNPTVADGKVAAVAMFREWLPTVPNLRYDIKRIISRGDMVWVHSHVTTGPEDRGLAVVDIFRMRKGKIVEHWDVAAPVAATALNDNGVF